MILVILLHLIIIHKNNIKPIIKNLLNHISQLDILNLKEKKKN